MNVVSTPLDPTLVQVPIISCRLVLLETVLCLFFTIMSDITPPTASFAQGNIT